MTTSDCAPSLSWASADTPHSWHELEPPPATNPGFAETGQYLLRKPVGAGWKLFIDDEQLESSPSTPECWLWHPGFYAGEVTAELARAGEVSTTLWLLDVSPDSRKIGGDMFRRIVEQLWAEDPELVAGTEPASRAVGHLGELSNPWIELSRLRQHAPEFLRSLGPIRARPRRQLVARRELVPLQRARRVDQRTALAAARFPLLAAALAGELDEPASLTERVDIPLAFETLDSPANRALLALTDALLRRCRSLRERLRCEVEKERDSETRTSLASRWPARLAFLDRLEGDLVLSCRREPLRSVRRPEISAAGLTAIASDPCYAQAWSCGWHALRPGVDGAPTSDRLWVSPTWEIYERWCFVKISRAVRDSNAELAWRKLDHGRRWVGRGSDRTMTVELQPTFPGGPEHVAKRWSLSKLRVPDIIVTIDDSRGRRFAVLDAKYRASRENVLDAMTSAHVYRDSLRIRDRRSECALVLIPAGGGAPWLEDVGFQREHGVGACVLSLEVGAAVPALLARVLSE